ncbi:Uncharacterised protein [Mycobacteroides abscessus subsp. abscessus]|nr:Uncharacterised protein [Mycobacteroides abscessus subsp. abscessus]
MSAIFLLDSIMSPIRAAMVSISATRSFKKPRFWPILVPIEPIAYGSEACSKGRPLGRVMLCTIEIPGVRTIFLATRSRLIMSVVLRISWSALMYSVSMESWLGWKWRSAASYPRDDSTLLGA